MAFQHVGYRHNWDDRVKSCEWTPIHFGCYRLIYQVGRSDFLHQCDEASGHMTHQKGYHLSLWSS